MTSQVYSFESMREEYLETLKVCCENGDIGLLQKKYETINASESDKRSTLDQVMRDYLIQQLAQQGKTVGAWEIYVTLCIEACRREMCTSTMPVVLLGDIFDALTLDQCEQLFAFVENGVSVWRQEMFFSACKNNLLRMCNDLLRRLSRSQNTVFCGRILLFLAKFFPFSERSGLNIVSEFNLDNITEFGGEDDVDMKDAFHDADDSLEEGETKSDSKLKIDYNLYCKFWALQDFFRNPNQCYNKVKWKTFATHTSAVLSAFSSYKLEDHQGKSNQLEMALGDDAPTEQYFAKFLTSQKLLELQLSDSNFRRYVLLQFLILFHYLKSTVKFKPENSELKSAQTDWIGNTTDNIYKLLEEIPPGGPKFATAVRHILKREDHWNSWKNEGCPEFQKPSQKASDDQGEEASDRKKPSQRPRKGRKRVGDMMREAVENKKILMGNTELTRLWNLYPSNLEACNSKDRDFLPSLESYFEKAIEQLDPASGIEEQYKRVNDGSFGWRALRLLARRSPHFFTHTSNTINKLPEYLETMIKKIAKNRPQLSTNEESKQEVMESEMQVGNDGIVEVDDDMKTDEKEEERKEVEEYGDGEVSREKPKPITEEQIVAVSEKLGSQWKKLASKLGYAKDEIEFFENKKPNDVERCQYMLVLWKGDNEEDAIPENLAYTLEGLELQEAAEVLV